MSILEIELTPEMEQRLREKAKRRGLEAKTYAQIVVMQDLQGEAPRQSKHSIMELHGIGRGTWAGIDVQAYINETRDEWDKPR